MSVLDDLDFEDVDDDREESHRSPPANPDRGVWRTKDGREVAVRAMDLGHLQNTYRLVRRYARRVKGKWQWPRLWAVQWALVFRAEIRRRRAEVAEHWVKREARRGGRVPAPPSTRPVPRRFQVIVHEIEERMKGPPVVPPRSWRHGKAVW